MVVCGATGRQGSAVIRQLLIDGSFNVVGLTRDVTSEDALKLRRLGVELAVADHMGQASLIKAFSGADFVFGVTQSWDARQRRHDTRIEIMQGKNIIWASAAAGVSHLVFSSFINPIDERTGVTFIDTKLIIENLIKENRVPHTIIRSPVFMDDIPIPTLGKKIIRHHYDGDTKLPYFSLSDLGKIVVNVFSERESYLNKTITTFSDLKTGKEIAEMLSRISDIPYSYESKSPIWLRLFRPEIFRLRRFMERLSAYDLIQILNDVHSPGKYPEWEFMSLKDFLKHKIGMDR